MRGRKFKQQLLDRSKQFEKKLGECINSAPTENSTDFFKQAMKMIRELIETSTKGLKSKEKLFIMASKSSLGNFFLIFKESLENNINNGMYSSELSEAGLNIIKILELFKKHFVLVDPATSQMYPIVNGSFKVFDADLYKLLARMCLNSIKRMRDSNQNHVHLNIPNEQALIAECRDHNENYLKCYEKYLADDLNVRDPNILTAKKISKNLAYLNYHSMQASLLVIEKRDQLAVQSLKKADEVYQAAFKDFTIEELLDVDDLVDYARELLIEIYRLIVINKATNDDMISTIKYLQYFDRYISDRLSIYNFLLANPHQAGELGYQIKALFEKKKVNTTIKNNIHNMVTDCQVYLFKKNMTLLSDLSSQYIFPADINYREELFKVDLKFSNNANFDFFIKECKAAQFSFDVNDHTITLNNFDQINTKQLVNISEHVQQQLSQHVETPQQRATIEPVSTVQLKKEQPVLDNQNQQTREINFFQRKNIAPTKYLTNPTMDSSKQEDQVQFTNGLTNVSDKVREFQHKNATHSQSADRKKKARHYLFIDPEFLTGLDETQKNNLLTIWQRGLGIGQSEGAKGIIKLEQKSRPTYKGKPYHYKLKDAGNSYRFFARPANDVVYDKNGQKHVLHVIDFADLKHKK
mgnify:CR=1 FL=1